MYGRQLVVGSLYPLPATAQSLLWCTTLFVVGLRGCSPVFGARLAGRPLMRLSELRKGAEVGGVESCRRRFVFAGKISVLKKQEQNDERSKQEASRRDHFDTAHKLQTVRIA